MVYLEDSKSSSEIHEFIGFLPNIHIPMLLVGNEKRYEMDVNKPAITKKLSDRIYLLSNGLPVIPPVPSIENQHICISPLVRSPVNSIHFQS